MASRTTSAVRCSPPTRPARGGAPRRQCATAPRTRWVRGQGGAGALRPLLLPEVPVLVPHGGLRRRRPQRQALPPAVVLVRAQAGRGRHPRQQAPP
jgi:hypothetical protein